ncbi:hypothetical protein G4228_018212 [Cervus hanglu yarkandensis]|nr:hypothetical protein G4228_018212 [Cervus hanglu yarkandensis]
MQRGPVFPNSYVCLLFPSARFSKNHAGRTHSVKDKAGQTHKPLDVFEFPDDSRFSGLSRLGENEKDEESYESFDPPLHSTAIYADEEEFSKHCGSHLPSIPQEKEAERSSDTSEIEASENESIKISAKKPRRKLKPISDESESPEESDVRRKVKPIENINTRHEAVSATVLPELSEKPAEAVTPQKTGPQSAESSAEKATLATEGQLKTQKNKMFPDKRKKPRSGATDSDTSDCAPIWCLKEKKASDIMELDVFLSAFENILLEYEQKIDSRVCKAAINKFHSDLKEELIKMKTQKNKMFPDKRKKPRSGATDSDTSDCAPIWCLKEKKASDIMELDVFLSAFENILLEYEQKIDSRVCKAAINKFHSDLKEELIKMLQEVQMLKTLKRKNAKMISDIEKKRQHLIEAQDELLRVEPELKQLHIKYEELQERKASLRKAAYFLSNLKQLYQDYAAVQEEEPSAKETYDSSSLPALLFKARPLLGAENHLQNINCQLEKLLDQK